MVFNAGEESSPNVFKTRALTNEYKDELVGSTFCSFANLVRISLLTLKNATYFEHGEEPRAFCISPSGKYLIVGWQNTDNLTSYEIQNSGELVLQHVIECLTPVAFAWC